ncbi:MAG: iron ABC transporter permease [Chloroflexi bacterium]|jgi:iron complex transport system permease protein|nr:iron ABC transporter permease [Chloroflexota bacterium]
MFTRQAGSRRGAKTLHGAARWQGWLVGLALLMLLISLFLGRYPGPYLTRPSALIEDELARRIVLELRLPRILAAFMLGAVLSASGLVFQMIFRNPLVESGFLGVSQGAAFGASLAIVALGGAPTVVQVCAAGFAFLGLAASYIISHRIRYGDWVLRLVLAGIAISAIYSAGTSILKYLADPLKHLPDITFWMLGGLWAITWPDVLQVLPVVLPSLLVLYLMRWRLNLLSLQDDTAFSLGAAPGRERLVLLVAAVASTAVLVSKAGLVGWIGLIVPHIVRRLFGADAQHALPGVMLVGGLFALLCDNVARTLLTGEIPLGILTSLAGAVFFLGLLTRAESVRRQ